MVRSAAERTASAVWKMFHKKVQPHELIKVKIPWPQQWGYAGLAKTTYYRSDKWEEDGDFYKYYHDHEGTIRVWHPVGMFDFLAKSPAPKIRSYPTAVAVLGYALGVDVERHDTGRVLHAKPERQSFLVASSTHVLWIVEPTAGITTMIAGPGLRVEARGIVG